MTSPQAAEIDRLMELHDEAIDQAVLQYRTAIDNYDGPLKPGARATLRAALEAALYLGEPVAWVPRAIKDLPKFHKMKKGEFVWEDADTEALPAVNKECFDVVAVYAAKDSA